MHKDTNFGNAMILRHFGPEKCKKSDPERQEFQERHDSLALWAREMPKTPPRKTRISETPCFFITLGQRIAKSNHKRHEFEETALIDPSKNANKIRKVFVLPETSHQS